MPRRLRIEYPGAIYHIMARGNGRQHIVRDDVDRERLLQGLARSVQRCGWRVYAFVVLTNHLHVVLKTPQPNLGRGMQVFLSAYANAWARRHKFTGHVFQGRYRTEMVEDESYLWTVTRYVHLNPVRARLVDDPALWAWSSYPGYAHSRRALDWVAYDELLQAWRAEFGGSGGAAAYRRYVGAGLVEPPRSPWLEAEQGWALGSREFLARLGRLVRQRAPGERRRESRFARGVELRRVLDVVCASYEVDRSELSRRGSPHEARAALAYLARKHTEATNAALVGILGLSRPESVPNLTRRFVALLAEHRKVRKRLTELESALAAGASAQ